VLYDGSGNGLGFIGMTSTCRGEFGAGARMCESEEIMDSDTLNVNDVPDEGCWVRPSWQPMSAAGGGSPTQRFGLDESGVYDDPGDLTCRGWTRDDSTEEGLVIGVNSIGLSRGAFSQEHCDVQRSIACCKPTPVPAPTSSLSIPIGAAALAGLSMLRGAG